MCNITLFALTKLLHLLKLCDEDYFKDLPADGRTVLQTPRVTNVRQVPPGEYYHIGLKKQLLSALSNLSVVPESLKLVFNIDGLKVHKYTKFELWPFLMKIVDIPILKHCIYPIGMYYGKGKGSIHDFLQEFMEELISLQETGLMFRDVVIRIEVIGFICDAPAKCYLLGVKGQGGFCSCTRCQIHGFTYEGRRVFLESDCEARTDADFRSGADREFQPDGCSSPLVNIRGLDMVKSIVIDTMHLIFLGIVRTLVDAWYNGPKPFKLSSNLRGRFSQDLFSSQVYVPKEFPRKPKDLSSGAHWKATESRTFLLYVGPALVKKYLDNDKYRHFLLLHSAMTILLSPVFCRSKEMLQKAKMSLQDFVESTPPLYSEAFVTHNIHNLLHLVDDVEHFSQFFQSFSLNDISCFPFENYLQCIKNLARGTANTLQQIARRLHEIMKCVDLAREKAREDSIYTYHPEQKHSQGPLLPGCSDPQYKSIKLSDFTMSRQMPDNCCLLKNDSVVLADNFAWSDEYNEMVIIGKRYLRKENLYETPHLQSSDLNIFKVERLSKRQMWRTSDIKAKCARFPLDEVTSAVFPLLHSDHSGPESLGLEL
nr:PREDICTED: uncharacterized protein LOC109040458 isoform X1 [Bemisia tabaci]